MKSYLCILLSLAMTLVFNLKSFAQEASPVIDPELRAAFNDAVDELEKTNSDTEKSNDTNDKKEKQEESPAPEN